MTLAVLHWTPSNLLISAGPKGGLGTRAPPPPPRRGRECPNKNKKKLFFHALYDIASIYGNALLGKITYDITGLLKENVAVGHRQGCECDPGL